jgi:hypothetical protein
MYIVTVSNYGVETAIHNSEIKLSSLILTKHLNQIDELS